MRCSKCIYPSNHPFGLTFNEKNICSGCLIHQEKFDLNWENRFELLKTKVDIYKGSGDYHCIVPIKGTPEYFYLLDIVKNKLGLNPLCVSFNSQFNSQVGIKNFDLLRDTFDVDLIHYTSNPNIYKKLIRESITKLNSMRWPYLAGEKQFPVQLAIEMNIPLIIWPFYQATEQAGVHSYTEEIEMTRRSRHQFDLMGIEPHELINIGSLISKSDIEDLNYPSNKNISKLNLKGIYLDNYIPWDSRILSEKMIKNFSAFSARNTRTFDTYDRTDDMTYMTIHDIIKYAKLGYSRVTDNLCREIRFNRISRDDALTIEKYYQSYYPKEQIEYFLKWIGIQTKSFEWILDRLPYENCYDNNITLNKEQKLFIDSFVVNTEDVHSTSDYIIFGKGLYTT
tara:strand:- start:423 stop:1607 length:1185 start_codon:yes stop_codon:yes gene_type:complete